MPYTSQSELVVRFGETFLISLTDRLEEGTGQIDADTVTRAIADADALIDGFIGTKYQLPMQVTPPLIAVLSRQISIYLLHVYEPSDKIKDGYKDALAQLKQIADGTITLNTATLVPDTLGGSGARVTDRERPMTQATMKGFI